MPPRELPDFATLGEREGFTGNRDDYDHPDNSMLDLVLTRRYGAPAPARPFRRWREFVLPTGVPPALVRPWTSHETALRMLHNLASAYTTRGDLGRAIRAARLRLLLPLDDRTRQTMGFELRRLEARLN